MNIIFISSIFPPESGGPATYVRRLSQDFHNKGHHVKLIALSEIEIDVDDPPYIIRIPKKGTIFRRSFRLFRAVLKHGKDVDIIYDNGGPWDTGIPIRWANIFLKKKLVTKVVGDNVWEYVRRNRLTDDGINEFQGKFYGPKIALLKYLRNKTTMGADLVITPGHYLAELVAGWGVKRENISVIHNAVDFSERNQEIPEIIKGWEGSKKIITTAARLVPWKGIDGIIRVIAELDNDVNLLVIGDGPELSNLRKLTETLGIDKRVRFTGRVTQKEVLSLLSHSDVFVLNTEYEGLPHIILEAFSVGVPVIATDICGNPEVVENGKNGLLVPVKDNKALKNAIMRLINDTGYSARLVSNSRERLNYFGWNRLFAQTERVFDRLLKGIKILFIASIYYPESGGPATYVRNLAHYLYGEGHKVKVIALSEVNKLPDDPFYLSRIPKRGSIFTRSLSLFLSIVKYGRDYDLLYDTGGGPWDTGLPVQMANFFLRKRLAIRVAGDIVWEYARRNRITVDGLDEFQLKSYGPIIMVMRLIRNYFARSADLVISGSNYVAGLTKIWGVDKKKISVTHNAIELINPRKIPTPEFEKPKGARKIVATIARLVPWKGIDALIEVTAQFPKDIHLLIIGDGPERERLTDLAKSLKVINRIHFIGRVPNEQIISFLSFADVFVLNTEYESLAHVIIEAYNAGIPVVATNITGNPEIIEDGKTGILVPLKDKDALKAAIERIITNKKFASKIVSASREKLPYFGLERQLKESEELFKDLIWGKEEGKAVR
ncbi:MAG: glycosyltransferase family 4 protein [Deltaproteobacteria bacterium]|uniref:Glycosyltransferase family 4 protein n=1 Tax=Candidatus Zymogenus saltonus TaxID=2844893 RepID=A0A9D8KDI8_9DELT|nr:glycosyltransferase family 4 protein [Candidatus Zymogenus saltonus]